MRSRKSTLRVLLDTSFVLPSFGIETGKEVLDGLKRLENVKAAIYYSRFSIVESLWVAARLSKSGAFDADRFDLGLRSILESGKYEEVREDAGAFNEALRLRMLGHNDMVDNILYASSVAFNLKFLTLDDELNDFVQAKRLSNTIMSPRDIC